MKRSSLVLMIAVVSALAGAPASATDFTFDVPVTITNVPRITSVLVGCYVSTLPAGTEGAAATANVIGRNEVMIEVAGGNYSGVVAVPVENRGTLRSADARSYACDLTGNARNDAGSIVSLNYSMWSQTLERMSGAPLDREVTLIEGNLP